MLNSVRARLTLWYAGALALALVAFALTAQILLARDISRRTDAALAEMAEGFIAGVAAEERDENGSVGRETAIVEAAHDFHLKDYRLAVCDGARLIASSDANEPPKSYATKRAPPQTALDSSPDCDAIPNGSFQTRALKGERLRVYATTLRGSDRTYRLIIAQSLRAQNELLGRVRRASFVAVPLALFAASLGGYFLARKSLAAVVLMSEQAARIGATNLHARLFVENEADELGQLARAFNGLLARLEESFERQCRFMADASHELRTPIAIISGESEVALSRLERAPSDYRESLTIVHDEGRRLARIVEDLFMLARADAGHYRLDFADFYLDELIEECVQHVRALALKRGVSLECRASVEALMRGDENLIRRALLNLIDNAIKYTPAGGAARVSLKRRGANYLVKISDTGTGIPIEAQPHIFERFYRADKARSRGAGDEDASGAGLGLAIARWVAEAHGGSLVLKRSDASGSLFVVTLPATEAFEKSEGENESARGK